VRFNRLTSEKREEVMARTMHSTIVVTMAHKDKGHDLYEEEKKDTSLEEMEGVKGGIAVLGSVYSLEAFSTTDGPGIRTNVILQGCPKSVSSAATPKRKRWPIGSNILNLPCLLPR
jgi:hypothetical protein